MKKTVRNSLKRIMAIQCLLFSFFAHDAKAVFLYWNNNGIDTPTSGTWDLTTPQWSLDAGPTASPVVWDTTAVAVFAVTNNPGGVSTNYGTFNINLDTAIGIGGLYNNLTNGSSSVTNLIFSGTGSFNLASGVNVFAAATTIAANNIFKVPITGSGSIEFQAVGGSEYFHVANSYSGGTRISTANGINFAASGAFGTGTITVNPGQAQIILATPATDFSGATFATVPITIANNFVANTTTPCNIIFVGLVAAPTTFSGNWDMGSQAQRLDFRTATVAAPTTISGVISGSGPLAKLGNGVLVLSGANTYTGQTIISNGTLSVSSFNQVVGGTASSSLGAPTTVGDGTIRIGAAAVGGQLIYTGAGETTDRVIDLASTTATVTNSADGTGAIVFTSDFTATGAGSKTLMLTGTNTSTNTISGAIVNNSAVNITALIKTNTGTWTLAGANTYSGKTTIQRGLLRVSSLNRVVGGSASSSLGAPTTVANGTIGLGALTLAGTLVYTGTGETTDRIIELTGTTGGGIIQNDGTGALNFTNNLLVTGAGVKALILQGTNTGTNTFAGNVTNGSAITAVTKAQAGTWNLVGSNSFSGNISISGGRLNIVNRFAMGRGTNIFSGNGSIDNFTGGDFIVTNALTLSGGSMTYVGESNNITYTGPVTISGANRTITVSSNTVTLTSPIGDLGQGRSFTKAGPGTLVLQGANTYAGNTVVNAGTLVLAASASIASQTNFTIAASATFDVSAHPAYIVPGTNIFTASGSNTVEGVSAAIIKGGTSVDLGTRPISLTFRPTSFTGDTGHPCLLVSQGTLLLGGNAFTVNNASGTPLGAGTYQLMQQSVGSITSSGSHTVTVTGSGLVANATASIEVDGGNVNLVVIASNAPGSFTGVTILGDGNVQLSFTGTPLAEYVVEAATNLNSPILWLPLSTNTADGSGTFNFIDLNATNYSERFYRTATD